MKTWKVYTVLAIFAVVFMGCQTPDEGNKNNKDLTGTITIIPDTTVFINTELTANYSGSETVGYLWKKDGTVINGENGTSYTPSDSGAYTVTVSATGYNSITSDPVTVIGGGINWDNQGTGTLNVVNNTDKDMVLFQGQTPSANYILGGIKALTSKTFDISDKVEDFNNGGYMIVRCMALNEYEANKGNLAQAKVEYSTMATYGQGKKFRITIWYESTGDYAYRITNLGRLGVELRKDNFNGEKAGFIPALASNFRLYANKSDNITLYPVFIFFQRSTGKVNTLVPNNFSSINVSPKLASGTEIETYPIPSAGANWSGFWNTLVHPVAYVTVTNNVPNQFAWVTLSRIQVSQNGYNSIISGETLTYEIAGTDDGSLEQDIVITYYNQTVKIPVKDSGGNTPKFKNGYDYTITVRFNGGTESDASNYTITFTEMAKRDLTNDLNTL